MAWLHFREPVSAWTHFAWLVLAVPGTWVLWHLSRGDRGKRVGLLTFGISLIICYGMSWLYHSVPRQVSVPFRILDHVGIFLLIAGTVTPIALVILRGWWRVGLLSGIWALAVAGITLRLTTRVPLSVLHILYLVMGWVGCATYFELARRLSSHAKIRPIWIGGIFYSVGAVINALDWPVLVPGVFEAHELFHLFVMTGTLWHFHFMLRTVVPHRQPAEAPQAAAAPAVELAPAPAR
jgi:hemolysin III